MNIWLALTALISVAAVIAAAPFIRRHERARLASEKSLAVYRDQLKEVDAEAAQGSLDNAQADAARTEIKRHMLGIGNSEDAAWQPLSSGERTFAAIAVSGVVVLGSVGLFAVTADIDSPSAPPPPILRSEASDVSAFERLTGRALESPGSSSTQSAAPAGGAGGRAPSALAPVDELVQRLVTRLQRNPKDVEGWRMLGWSYFSMERFDEAAAAYQHAIDLNPDSAEYRDGRTESLLRAANGKVTPEVRSAMEETLKLQPSDPRARFIKGLAIEQSGDPAGAKREWEELLRDIDPNDPWAREIARKIGTEAKGGSEPAAPAAAARPSLSSPANPQASEAKGPTADEVRAAEAMPPSDRIAMIQKMVGSLAERLEKSPRDADGWIRLVRSWAVLGENDKAKQALASALKIFSDEPLQVQRISSAAADIGLGR